MSIISSVSDQFSKWLCTDLDRWIIAVFRSHKIICHQQHSISITHSSFQVFPASLNVPLSPHHSTVFPRHTVNHIHHLIISLTWSQSIEVREFNQPHYHNQFFEQTAHLYLNVFIYLYYNEARSPMIAFPQAWLHAMDVNDIIYSLIDLLFFITSAHPLPIVTMSTNLLVHPSNVSFDCNIFLIGRYCWHKTESRKNIHLADEYTRRMNTLTGSRAAGRTLRSFSIIKPDDVTAMLDHRLLDHWPPGGSRLSALFQLFSDRCPYFRLISADAARLPVRFDIAADMFIQKCCRAATATRRTASPHDQTRNHYYCSSIYQCFRVWQWSFNSIPRWRDGIWKRLQA